MVVAFSCKGRVVHRHGLAVQGERVAFGSTTGNLFVSEGRGESFVAVAHHLPPIYSVRAEIGARAGPGPRRFS